MWNNQSGDAGYGGFGGDQGGGFQTGGFSSPQAQGSQGEGRRAKNRAQNITPCTVAQIIKAEQQDDKFIIDNMELHQVTIVGLVRSVNETPTRLEYFIDDMSGPPIEVRQFVDNDDQTPDQERTIPMRENTYVRVFAHVRAFGGKRNLAAFRLYQLTDMNELTTHLLEVFHAHLKSTKGSGESGGMQAVGYGDMTTSGGAMDTYAGAQPDNMNGLNNMQKQVSLVIRSCRDEQGMSISSICERLRGMPATAIKEAVEFLSNEGHIYSTIDDDHFRSTESMD